jgi:hypothetical protein
MKQRLGPENQRLVDPGVTAQLRRPDDVASSNSNPLRPDENGVPASVALVTRLPYLLLVGLILRYIGVPFRFERGLT